MMLGQWRNWVTVLALAMGGVAPLIAADETNEPTSGPGRRMNAEEDVISCQLAPVTAQQASGTVPRLAQCKLR